MSYSVGTPHFSFSYLKNCLVDNDTLIGIFDFEFNNQNYTLLFTFIDESDKARILFTQVGTQKTLTLVSDSECRVSTYITPKKYKELIDFFDIRYNKNEPFKPIFLFQTINNHLTFKQVNYNSPRQDRANTYSLPNPNAIYYNYMTDWSTKDGNKHFSCFNRQKVKLLLPELYDSLKERNVTVYFKEEAISEKEEAKSIKLDLSRL